MREGRVLSRVSPATPSCMKRSCQRQIARLSLPTARMIAVVPLPSAVSKTIRARHTCFCGLLRSRTITFNRTRSSGVTAMDIPLRMAQNRTKRNHAESSGVFRQVVSTSVCPCRPMPRTNQANEERSDDEFLAR